MDGRLQSEIEKMNEHYSRSYLIISGSWADYYKDRAIKKKRGFVKQVRHFAGTQYLGMVASISARTNTKVLQVDNDEQFVELLQKLAEKSTDGKVFKAPEFKRAKTDDKIFINMLLAFPGVSEFKAERIIDKYKTWAKFETAVLDGTFDMPGFGSKSKSMFKTALKR